MKKILLVKSVLCAFCFANSVAYAQNFTSSSGSRYNTNVSSSVERTISAQRNVYGRSNGRRSESKYTSTTINNEEDFFLELNGEICDLRKSVFIASSNDGSQSTAFYVKMGGKTFISTGLKTKGNEFVSNFMSVDGSSFELPKKGFVAPGKDVVLMPVSSKALKNDAIVLDMAKQINTFVEIGDEVLIPGNHDTKGFIQVKRGFVTGFGPTSIEISGSQKLFELGSIGAPVIHKKTGTCIGIVSFVVEDLKSRGNVRVRQSLNLEDKYDTSGRFYVVRFDVKLDWFETSLEKLEKINLYLRDASLTCDYIEEYIIKYCNARNIHNCLPTDNLQQIDGMDELKEFIFNFNARIESDSANRNGYSNLKWQLNVEDLLRDLIKLISQYNSFLKSYKADIILPKDIIPLLRNLNKQRDSMNSQLKSFQRRR